MRRTTLVFVSVRGRITVAVTAVFALAMVFGTWFLLDRAEQAWVDDLRAQDMAELEMIAHDLLAMEALEAMISQGVVLPVGEGGTSFALTDESGVLVGSTPPGLFGGVVVASEIPADEVPDVTISGMARPVGMVGENTTVSLPVEFQSGALTLTASSSLEPVRAGLSTLRGLLVFAVPALVAGVGATSWFVTGRAFAPVEDITSKVERITDDRLDDRVPVPDSRDEVAHLAVTMNSMLDRLATSRRRQRQFVSDASHELRNPIAASKTRLEVALAHPDHVAWSETAGAVLEEQERLEHLVDSLLQLARFDEQTSAVTEEVDLDDVVFVEAQRVADIAISVDDVAPTRITGNRQQLTYAVRNLIDNAIRHTASRVSIALKSGEDSVVLTVDDDGAGIPADKRDAVFERFVRLDESRDRTRGGAGLGLALVAAVADAHGGTARAMDSPLGGARFELVLPLSNSLS
ncbi:MAG: HAMP domain-containing histidine kinase [bacterium]|nr:HAMP domain-containing histidine kinase [bacterium]